jgi:hypothetical protein
MNSIPELQNSEPFLRLLKARSQVYADAVRLQMAQLVFTVVLPTVGALVGLRVEQARPYVAVLAIVITIVDVAWLDRVQRGKLKTAAKIAEQFDCNLLDMSWNKFTAGKQVDPEMIEASACAWKNGNAKLLNWYPAAVGKAPKHLARIICQRTNLWYDSQLRRRYGTSLVVGTGVVVILLFLAGLIAGLSMLDFVVTVLSPATPMLIWAIRDCLRQRDAAEALESVKGEAEAMWEKAAPGGCDEGECLARSREFQDAIYARRVANPLVFPFIYALLRPSMEKQMNAGAEELLKSIGIEA